MSAGNGSDSGLKSHQPITVVSPKVARWASAAVITMVVLSFLSVYWICPKYFVENSERSAHGGALGAVDVVQRGGFPVYITAAIPFFMAMIAVEFFVTLIAGAPSVAAEYSVENSWSSLAAGVTQQLMVLLIKRPLLIASAPYAALHAAVAVPFGLALPVDAWWTWCLGLVAADLGYYWLHRSCHECGLLWAGHGVHHSSDQYNLTTALRQSWVQALAAPLFFLPLAVCFPPPVYMAVEQANIVYQFWVHTCLVRRLPWPLEAVLMTPSHHRVHHDRRVHKNFGGMLIVWDRLFGSFLDEHAAYAAHAAAAAAAAGGADAGPSQAEELVLYGVLTRQETWTESVTQSMLWQPIFRAARTGGLAGAARAAWRGPGFSTAGAPRTLRPPLPSAVRVRYTSALHPVGKAYVVLHFLIVVGAGFSLIASSGPGARVAELVGPVAAILATLAVQGLLLDCRPAGRTLEAGRLALGIAWACGASGTPGPVAVSAGLLCAASLALIVGRPACFGAQSGGPPAGGDPSGPRAAKPGAAAGSVRPRRAMTPDEDN